ncbi:CopG/MetJ family transcription regulator fused to thiamine monophosphate kinase-like domain [Methanonatronarchaeum thermophilum]|uniref:CopG/MetJ family transcription regulator fused to thiamine monophosphate kinase-like domain n=2 Tax=Methanonatronarchaeum thermophilum TaxID=1927129 RepID=A0A1Y3GF23_9EURY|nr:CopG/MetJ family transcription regulator fused to thiamine monophosphate kinase-like domain [Methanonatronarchaeum thermophilum]
MDKQIDSVSSEFGLSRSEVIRQALTIYFNIIGDIDKLTNIRDLSKEEIQVSHENTRDVHFINLDSFNISIVIANSSSGGIGPKEHDNVSVNGDVVGSIIARTALIKMLSIHGEPTTIMLNFSNEMEETGNQIIKGVRTECKKIGIKNIVIGHSEENIKTCQTGVSITAIGVIDKEKQKTRKTQIKAGDKIYCIGNPVVGENILNTDLPQLEDIKLLQRNKSIKKIYPIGHQGIKKELTNQLKDKKHRIKWKKTNIDLNRSAGPSSAVIAITKPNIDKQKIKKRTRIQTTEIAEIT